MRQPTKLLQVTVPAHLYWRLARTAADSAASKTAIVVAWLTSLPRAASELDQVEAGQEMTGGRR